ncbi:MAG: MBL fold metallo-hydrolase, partial [Candidatus Hermodarchaeota archaeon]
MRFQEIFENVYQFNDYVNVYVIKNKKEAILIDFGSGDILKYLTEIGVYTVDYLFHTHYHRDQCFGDKHAIEKGIKIGGPKKESQLFENVEDFWNTKSFYDIYYFKPTFFVSTYNIPLDVKFKHGDTFNWGPYSLTVTKTNGHTTESISYILTIGDKIIAFTGDLIHSRGKVITYYDLEYIYNDNGEGGMKRSLKSFQKLLSHSPDILLPSHGSAIYNVKEAIQQLTDKFENARFTFCSEFSGIDVEFYDLKEREIKPVNITTEFPSIFHKGQCPPFIIKGHDH